MFEPIHGLVVAVDPKTATCYPYFLHLQEQGPSAVRGQTFKLDLTAVQ
jgi:hypothetical protein